MVGVPSGYSFISCVKSLENMGLDILKLSLETDLFEPAIFLKTGFVSY